MEGGLTKLASITIFVTLFVILLPSVNSSHQDYTKTTSSPTNSSSIHVLKLNPKLLLEIKIHGFLHWTSMGFLMPVGILTIRMSNTENCRRRLKILVYIHVISQILAVLISTTGAIMSIKNFNNSFNNNHQRIGLALYGIVWLQVLIGFLRPQRGSKGRSAWFFGHWLVGTVTTLLGIINIYTGFQAYHEKTSKSVKLWAILFTTEICFIAFFYLFQDKWVYIKKQGRILGNEQSRRFTEKSSTNGDKQKESISDP